MDRLKNKLQFNNISTTTVLSLANSSFFALSSSHFFFQHNTVQSPFCWQYLHHYCIIFNCSSASRLDICMSVICQSLKVRFYGFSQEHHCVPCTGRRLGWISCLNHFKKGLLWVQILWSCRSFCLSYWTCLACSSRSVSSYLLSHFIALHWFFVLGLCSQPTLGSISLWLVLLRFVPAQGVPKGWNLAAWHLHLYLWGCFGVACSFTDLLWRRLTVVDSFQSHFCSPIVMFV